MKIKTIIGFGLVLATFLFVSESSAQRSLVTSKVIKENNRRQKLAISARYPQISGASDFNKRAEQLVRRQIADFKRELDPPDSYTTRNRELSIGYKVSFSDNRIISIGFGAGTDTGGVHPNSYSFVLNYDLKQQRELALYDLFSSSDYLRRFSDYCIRQLRNQVSDYETLRDGAAPSSDNYKSWLITRSGIQITFDAYQVASYAEGPKTVVVPYSVLKRQIAKGGPISHLVK